MTPGEWWYVENRHYERGYVPHTYLRAYPDSGSVDPAELAEVEEERRQKNAAEDEITVVKEEEEEEGGTK